MTFDTASKATAEGKKERGGVIKSETLHSMNPFEKKQDTRNLSPEQRRKES